MMRLIDADALIAELNESHFPGAPYVDAGISIAIGKVFDAPTIEPELRWISCSEKLPDKADFYLVSSKSKEYPDDPDDVYTHVRFYDCCEWACTNRTVTAWMPLPEPYREEGGK